MGTRDPGQNRANPGGGDTKVEPSIKYRNCIFFFLAKVYRIRRGSRGGERGGTRREVEKKTSRKNAK
jgi:hypothetical protein